MRFSIANLQIIAAIHRAKATCLVAKIAEA
jgi:hypothetical protein